jgi:hypothetical protein
VMAQGMAQSCEAAPPCGCPRWETDYRLRAGRFVLYRAGGDRVRDGRAEREPTVPDLPSAIRKAITPNTNNPLPSVAIKSPWLMPSIRNTSDPTRNNNQPTRVAIRRTLAAWAAGGRARVAVVDTGN